MSGLPIFDTWFSNYEYYSIDIIQSASACCWTHTKCRIHEITPCIAYGFSHGRPIICILVTKTHRIESCVRDNSKNDFDTDLGFNNMNIISKSHFCKFHRKGSYFKFSKIKIKLYSTPKLENCRLELPTWRQSSRHHRLFYVFLRHIGLYSSICPIHGTK